MKSFAQLVKCVCYIAGQHFYLRYGWLFIKKIQYFTIENVTTPDAARCRHNAVNFLQNPFNKHPMASTGYLLWFENMIHFLPHPILPNYFKWANCVEVIFIFIVLIVWRRNWTNDGRIPFVSTTRIWWQEQSTCMHTHSYKPARL